ncbi:MAG: RHS repeat protein, partial [Desulfobacterales bacterium]
MKKTVPDAPDSNTVAKLYTWGLDLSGQLQGAGGVGGLLSVTKHEEQGTKNPYYPSYDANGNVSEYVDDTDSVVAHYEYSPFGKITNSSGSKADAFNHRFSTKYHDTETALYY